MAGKRSLNIIILAALAVLTLGWAASAAGGTPGDAGMLSLRLGVGAREAGMGETGVAAALRYVAGPVRGEGPWKVGDAVVTVLGCHGSDPELASEFAAWQAAREQLGADYPRAEHIARLMREAAAQRH